MATIGIKYNLLDIARATDPDGMIAKTVEHMNQVNQIIDDMVYMEGNLQTGHQTTVRTGLPTVSWRKLNYGVPQSKSTKQKITETCGMLEVFSEIDESEVNLNGNKESFRFSEDKAFIEAMNQEMADTLFHGDVTVDSEKFTGLASRLDSISTDTTNIGYQIVDAGGTESDNASVYIVGWSPETVTCIYPKGSKVGLSVEDLGKLKVYDALGNPYMAYSTHYKWDLGLCVKDWKYIARVANIDISDLKTAGTSSDVSPEILNYLTIAVSKIKSLNNCNPVMYMNRTVLTYLKIIMRNKLNINLTMSDYMERKDVLFFDGIPCRLIDEEILTNAETQIS